MSARDDGTRRIRAMTAACENISTEALEAGVVDKLVEALGAIASPLDCGCVPCTGQCRSQLPLELEVEGRQDIARDALDLARGEQS